MALAEFESARTLLRWASVDIQNFYLSEQAFIDDAPYEVFTELDADTGHHFLKARMAKVPDELCKLASHALWDIKHSLDHATCAAVRKIYGPDIDDIHFPIRSHLNSFESALRATMKVAGAEVLKYPVQLHDVLRRLEPYPTSDSYSGGSDEICALSKLANDTKHSVSLSATASVGILGMKAIGGLIKFFPEPHISPENELTLALVNLSTGFDMELNIASCVCFGDVKLLKRVPASKVLSEFYVAALDATNNLEMLFI